MGDYAMIFIVLTDKDRIAAIKRVFARVSFVLIPLSVLFIKYYPALGRQYATNWDSTVFFTGVTTDKNMLGVCYLIFGLASMWRFLQELQAGKAERKKGPMIAHGVVVLLTAWVAMMANSMTSLSCFLLGSTIMAAVGFPKIAKKRMLVHAMVFLVLLKSLGRNPTLTGRTELWSTIRGMTTSPILGTGFESFWLGARLEKLWSIYWWHPNEAHNGYLEMYLNLGWVGVTLLAGIIINGYRNVIRRLGQDRVTGPLFLAYFFVGVAYNFTEAATRTMSPVWIFLIMATIALPKAQVALPLPQPLPPPAGVQKKRTVQRRPEQIPA